MNRTRVALIALLALLPFAPPASAAPFTPELEADLAFAAEWWGEAPTGCSSITAQVVPGAELEGARGSATQPEPGAAPVACVLSINEAIIDVPCVRRETVLHEYGHLTGHGHSDDPASIMGVERVSFGLCGPEMVAQARRELRVKAAWCRQRPNSKRRRECWNGYEQMHRALLRLLAEPRLTR